MIKYHWTQRAVLCALALMAVFITQRDSFNGDYAQFVRDYSDFTGIAHGYSTAMRDGPHWWIGTWINENQAQYYRPLASYMHFMQQWLTNNGYFQLVTLGSILMFAGICAMTGAIVRRLTGSVLAAGVTIIAMSTLQSGIEHQWGCWMMTDNVLVVIFNLLGILVLLEYLRQPSLGLLFSLWACVLLAVFSKEQGIMLAPSLAILVTLLPRSEHSRDAMTNVAIMCAASVLLYKFGRGMLSLAAPMAPSDFLAKVRHDFQTQESAEFFLVSNAWILGLVQVVILLLPPVLCWFLPAFKESLVRCKIAVPLALFLCARLAVLPAEIHGVSGLPMRFLVTWMWWMPLIAVCGFEAWQLVCCKVQASQESAAPASGTLNTAATPPA